MTDESRKAMTSDRIREIQNQTACPQSVTVMRALNQVWNEVAQGCDEEIVSARAIGWLQGHESRDIEIAGRDAEIAALKAEAQVLKSLITSMGGTALQIESFKTSSYITNIAGEQHE